MKYVMTLTLALGLLAGCAKNSGHHCDGWKPIYIEDSDLGIISDELTTGIVTHNEYGEAVGCW